MQTQTATADRGKKVPDYLRTPQAPGNFDLFASSDTPISVIEDLGKLVDGRFEIDLADKSLLVKYEAIANRMTGVGINIPPARQAEGFLNAFALLHHARKGKLPQGVTAGGMMQQAFQQYKSVLLPLGFALRNAGFDAQLKGDAEWQAASVEARKMAKERDIRLDVTPLMMSLLSYWMPDVKDACERLKRGEPVVRPSAAHTATGEAEDEFHDINLRLNDIYIEEMHELPTKVARGPRL